MYLTGRLTVAVCAFALSIPAAGARQVSGNSSALADSRVVECRVLEAHANPAPAALVVIFHQRQKQDQPRLAELIQENSGSGVEIQIGGSAWTRVTVFRLRTSFGRGMFLLPADSGKLQDGETFRIRFLKQAQK